MLKRRAVNRIFLSTIVFFVMFTLYSFKILDNDYNEDIDNISNEEVIYTLNNDGFISKTSIYVSKVLSLEDKIKAKLEAMTYENDKNALLPSYFNPILPSNTKVLDVVVEDSLVKVYFSKELENINEEQSSQMVEAIVYTITDENILGIEIYVDGEILKYIPHTKEELPTILTKDIGINKEYNVSNLNDITKVFMMYYTSSNNEYYEVPVTKYVNDSREKLEIIFDELGKIDISSNLISLVEGVKVIDYEILSDKIIINVNKELSSKEIDLVITSLFSNYSVKKIELLVQGEKFFEKVLEN